MAWSKDIRDRITRDELAKSVPEAEKLLELHQERKVHITGCFAYMHNIYVYIMIAREFAAVWNALMIVEGFVMVWSVSVIVHVPSS